MATKKMSRESYDKLVAELDDLKINKRKEVAERLKVARSYGDLSENAEYDEAKNEQAILEAHIQELQYTIDNAEIVDDDSISVDEIGMSSKITIKRLDTGKIEVHLKPAAMPEFLERTASLKSDRWNMIKTFEGFNHVTIEFIDPHVDKGLALRKFSEVNGIPLSEIMTFGDQDNDIALLEAASWGVCLKNGSDPTKAGAQAVTEYGVEEDGVGRYLETWLVSR